MERAVRRAENADVITMESHWLFRMSVVLLGQGWINRTILSRRRPTAAPYERNVIVILINLQQSECLLVCFSPGGVCCAGFGAVPVESAQGASSDSAVMSQCSAGDEPPALVASPQCPPASKSQSSAATQHLSPLSHNPPDFFHPCGQCVKSSTYYSEHFQPLHHHHHHHRSVPPRIRLFVVLFFYSTLSKLLVHMPCSSWFFSSPLATGDHAVICPFQLFHAILGPFSLLCFFVLLSEHLWCLSSICSYLLHFSPKSGWFFPAHSYFFQFDFTSKSKIHFLQAPCTS